jgi:23S rRNA maturation-related 3'-5' exoribonuclease YhaM
MIRNTLLTCVKIYLRRKQEKGDLVVMDCPPQSRNQNPIENLWDNLKRERVKHDPTSKDNLWDVLNQCWNNLKSAVLRRLVESMPGRIKAVLKSKGGHSHHTKY